MELMQINDELVDAFDITNNEDFPFSNTWKKTYNAIEKSLQEFGDLTERERILKKVAGMVNVLVRHGTTYEDIVLETAQVYIFSKETNLDALQFENAFGRYVVEGAKVLNQELNTDDKVAQVFENKEMRYLGKIKIAEYIVELVLNSDVSKRLLSEIDTVINKYEKNTHKGLMKILVAERGKRT